MQWPERSRELLAAAMSARPGFSRWKPSWIAAVLAVLSAAVLAAALAHVRHEDLDAADRMANWTAIVIAEQTARSLQTVDLRLDAVAGTLAVLEQSSTLTQDSARQMLRANLRGLPYVRAIWAIAPDGHIAYDSDIGNVGTYLGDRAYFKAHLSGPKTDFYVGPPVRSRSIGTWLLGASKPMRSPDGTLRYVIVASVEPPFFDSVWRQADLGPGGAIALFNRSGTMMMRSPPDDASMGRDLAQLPLFREHLPKADAGVFQATSPLDQRERVVGYRTLPGYPQLVVAVGLSLDRVLAPVHRLAAMAGGVWLAALLLGTLLVLRLERQGSRLRNQSELLAMAGQVARAAPWVADLERGEMFCSEQAAAMLELPTDRPTPIADMLAMMPSASATTARRALQQAKAAGRSFDIEVELATASGRRVWLRCMAEPVRDDAGGGTWLMGTQQDVTERRELIEQVHVLNADLEAKVAQRTAELEEARHVADAANEAKSAFLANVSHEIRTPMNAILGLTRMLRRQATAPEQLARLRQIEASGQHLLALINDILDLSKIEAGRLELHAADFALRRTVDELVALVRPQAEAKGLRLDYAPGELPERAVGDATRVRQLLFNYLGNAIKFTNAGCVRLRCSVLDRSERTVRLRFEVSDTGIGIAPERLAGLFRPFEQADGSSSRQASGTGLGLAINRHLAQLMAGDVGASSVPGQGSTFWCSLELGRSEAAARRAEAAAADADLLPRLRSHYGGLRVLLAEDNDLSAEVACDLLQDAGLLVEVARDGVEAVARAREQVYDFVLMDMQMPRVDGIAATQAIRALPAWQRVPIIALTANVFASDRRRCEEAGMNDFLTKPLRPEDLYRTLLRWAEPAAADAAAPGSADKPGPEKSSSPAAGRQDLEQLAGRPDMQRDVVLSFRAAAPRYFELFAAFLARHACSPQAIRERVDQQDLAGAAAQAHSLAGGAAVLGALAVQRSAVALEHALRFADGSEAARGVVLADLDELASALAALPGAGDGCARGSDGPG
jgi:hypothetical protein